MGNAQIIIVEDERIVASDLKRRLDQLGYEVKAIVSSGEEAITKAEKCKPDLVLMDIVLKGSMDGITAANKIHALFNIPVVYLTAYTDRETLKRVKVSEPYGYLVKPFEERELIAAIEIALERHKSVSKLKEKEQHFRFLIENASDIIIVINSRGIIEYGSPSIKRVLGYDPEDYLNQKLEKFTCPDDTIRLSNIFIEKNGTTGVIPPFEIRIKHKDESWRHIEMVANNMLEDPELSGIVINARDVTERKAAEDNFSKAHQELKAIFKALPDLFFLLDRDGTILDYNAGTLSELFLPPEEFLGRRIEEVMPKNVAESMTRAMEKLSVTGALEVAEYSLAINNASNFYEARLLPLQKSQIIAIVRNVTERKKSEEKEKKYINDLGFLSQTAMDFVRIRPDQDIFYYIGKSIKKIAGDSVVIVCSYDENNELINVKNVMGIEGQYHAILKLLKTDPMSMRFKVLPEVRKVMALGKLSNIQVNLHKLLLKKIPSEVCEKVEKLLGVKKYFTIGLSHGDVLFGNVAILMRKEDGQLDTNLIETFANQAAIALQRGKAEEQLKYFSLHDPLTGLYNRAFFEEEMHRFDMERIASVGLIMCDVDGLKLVNDIMGHKTGDGLLMVISGIIRDACRRGDLVARLGGDEFAVLLPNIDQLTIDNLCQRIKKTMQMYNAKNPELPLSISIGYTLRNKDSVSIMDLFKEADNIMYRQKLDNHGLLIQNFVKALGARGVLSEGKVARLENLVTHFAMSLGLSDIEIKELKLLARYSDIGKVGISDKILLKSQPLDPGELAEVKRHCEIGYHIALFSPDLIPIANLILKHHEWWNGQGYPLGLSGGDIPLECRMLAITEAYEAMTRDRPHSKAMSHGEAVAELKKFAGTQFDPFLIEKFVGMF